MASGIFKSSAGGASGPSGSGTDNRVVRWDGTSNIQDSGVTLDDSDNISGLGTITGTGDVTINTDAFFVDASAKRIGINQLTPEAGIHITDLGGDPSINNIILENTSGSDPGRLEGQFAAATSNINILELDAEWDGTRVARILLKSGADTVNKDDASIVFQTAAAGTATDVLTLESDGGLTVESAANADLEWATDGAGKIGTSSSAGRPSELHVVGDITAGQTDFFFDESQGFLGINQGTPASVLDIVSRGNGEFFSTQIHINADGTNTTALIQGEHDEATAGRDILTVCGEWNGTIVGCFEIETGPDTVNKDDGRINFRTASAGTLSSQMILHHDGGLVMTGATGGSQGSGTINATAVYDDSVILTDFVFEEDYTQASIDEMEKFYTEEKHLPTIDGRKIWEKDGRFSVGKVAQQLWETVEVQAKYIAELNKRIKKLEAR